MELTSNQIFLLNNVFTKVKYDKLKEKYIIHITDYIHLNLNQTRMRLLEKMCAENNIELEKLPPQLTIRETDKLLLEYNRLKSDSSKNKDEINHIRNKIVTGNLAFLYQLVAIHIKSIDSEEDRKDLYQDAYSVLIKAVDSYNPEEKKSFVEHIYHLTYDYIIKKIQYMKNPEYLKLAVSKINSSFEEYVKKNGKTPPLIILSSMTKYSPEIIKELQKFENAVEIDSTDLIAEKEEELGKVIIEQNGYGSEEQLMELFSSNQVQKVLATLPKNQQDVLTVCFGLDGNGIRNNSEASEELGISKTRIGEFKAEALINLSLPPRRNHLQGIYSGNSRVSYLDRGMLKYRYDESIIEKNKEYIEDFLIRHMNKKELAKIINKLPEKFRNALLLIYGAADGIEYSNQEAAKILGIPLTTFYSRRNQGMLMLRNLLEERYKYDYKYARVGIMDRDYLDGLMDEYMYGTPISKRKSERR